MYDDYYSMNAAVPEASLYSYNGPFVGERQPNRAKLAKRRKANKAARKARKQ